MSLFRWESEAGRRVRERLEAWAYAVVMTETLTRSGAGGGSSSPSPDYVRGDLFGAVDVELTIREYGAPRHLQALLVWAFHPSRFDVETTIEYGFPEGREPLRQALDQAPPEGAIAVRFVHGAAVWQEPDWAAFPGDQLTDSFLARYYPRTSMRARELFYRRAVRDFVVFMVDRRGLAPDPSQMY